MKEIVTKAITNDADLNDLGISADNVYSTNSKSKYDEELFVILNWGFVSNWLTSKTRNGKQFLSIWVHDKQHDTGRIDHIIRRIFSVMTGIEDVTDETGRVSVVDWQGDSDDGYDDQFHTTTRSTDYVVIGK